MKSAAVPSAILSLLALALSSPPLVAADALRQGMQRAQTDALGTRSERTREEMEAAQTDGVGWKRGKRRGDEEWFDPLRFNREDAAAESSSTSAAQSDPRATASALAADGSDPAVRSAGETSWGGVTAAGNLPSSAGRTGGLGKGIVNGWERAGASGSGRSERAPGHARRSGIVSAGGGVHVPGRHSGGVVTGAGAVYSPARHAAGIVSGGGAPLSSGAAMRPAAGAGIVTGTGAAAIPSVTNGVRAGIVNAAGGPPGHAKAHGRRP